MDWLENRFELIPDSFDEDNVQRLQVPNNNVFVEEVWEEASEVEYSLESSEQFIDQISENSDDNQMIREHWESSEASDCNPWLQFENECSLESSEQFIDQISENSYDDQMTMINERIREHGESSEASDCNPWLQFENESSLDSCEQFIDQVSENSDDNQMTMINERIREYGESSAASDCNAWLQDGNVMDYWREEQGKEDLSLQECILRSLQKSDDSGIVDCNIMRDRVGERLVEQHEIGCSPKECNGHELQKPRDGGMINEMSIEHGESSTHLDVRIKREIECFREIKELDGRSCVCNLKDFIETPNLYSAMEFWKNGHASIHLVNIMRGIVNEVKCLHQSNIVHRDIKPENILIIKTTNGELCAKIADLGMSKVLSEDNASLTRTRHACGTLGWSAPELSERGPHTKAVDIFSLGCVLFYCCTKGKLPFGINENCKGKNLEDNVEDSISNLSLLEDQLEARDLIVHLLNIVPNERPTADQALKHPFFWTAKQKLEFMKDASDRVLKDRKNKETALSTAVEGCLNLDNGSWDTNPKWDKRFLQHMSKFPRAKYDRKEVSRGIDSVYPSQIELGPVYDSLYPSIESNDLFENPSSLSNSISSVELGRDFDIPLITDQPNSHPVLDLSDQDRDDGSNEKAVASKTDISSCEQLKDLLNSELLKKEGSKLAMTSSELCKELDKLTPTHLVYLEKELGRGNCTVVYEGKCGGLPVAIKRVWLDFIKLIVREVGILILSDQLNNIVQYHGMKKHDNYVDIILELCTCNLTNLIDMLRIRDDVTISSESKPALHAAQNPKWMSILVMLEGIKFWKEENGHVSTDLVNFMRGIVNGIRHLHELKIIHRDIKPENILVRKIDGTICPKIADMGISKRLPEGKSSLTCTSLGTLSWIAPELLKQNQQTMAADIFSMGLVLYYCCSKGEHPFDKEGFIEYNIRNQPPDLSHIKDQLDAHDLIRYLLEKDPTKRPTAEEVLKHPFFWTPEQKLEFLKAASDCIKKARRNKIALFNAVEGCLKLNAPWDTLLDREFVQHMFSFKHACYNRKKVKDLLRIIRNGLAHFNELSQSAQAAIGMSAEAREAYFSSIFPNLLFNVYQVLLYDQFAGDNEINKYKWR